MVRLGGYERRRTWEMSGGQQQRVALARALVNRPTVLLLDEPLGALDLKLRKEMQLELKALQREVGITFVYVTHDQEEALTMSDVIVVMKDGLIQQQGGPTELYERPVNRFVADFIGTSNFIDGERRRIRRIDRDGHRPDTRWTRPPRPTHRRDRCGRRRGRGHGGDPARSDSSVARDGTAAPDGMDPGRWTDLPGHVPGRSDRVPRPHPAGGRAHRPSPERIGGGRGPGGRSGRSGGRPVARGGQPRPRGMSGQHVRAGGAGTEEE